MKAKMHQDVWVGIFIILFCGCFFLLSMGKPSDSMYFPRILLGIMTVMAIPIIVGGVRKTKAATAEAPVKNTISLKALGVPSRAFLVIAGYVFLFWLAGYFVATALFLPAMMLYFRLRKPVQIILIAVGYVVIIYVMFVLQLNVPVLDFGYIQLMMQM